ncbi:putative F-box/LRR-repeat protein 22 [Panicum miliaceum]|uniref:F-box/LRR-repeat protein 22 n=1 Tax=Panicum miliaceum TaxID=4540 RepID=A0A3L6RI22_PANMI|nr:putative F-box/LRR-repeat protein 22 [Panicum miliaceum]
MRDWAALPRDILLEILGRLQQVDVLRGAGLACAPWWRAAVEEPALWRTIDVAFNEDELINTQAWEARVAMARSAVDRSAGQCESFRGVADRHLLAYLAARSSPSLRSLHVAFWCLPDAFVDRVLTKLPMLERLVLVHGRVLKGTLLGLLEHCPRLEVLDAGDSTIDKPAGLGTMFMLYRKMKVFHAPCVGYCPRCCCPRCLSEEPPS